VCVVPQFDPDDEEQPVSTGIPTAAASVVAHSNVHVRVTR
jgi:hypothetical protein